jgi:hypothetical protein
MTLNSIGTGIELRRHTRSFRKEGTKYSWFFQPSKPHNSTLRRQHIRGHAWGQALLFVLECYWQPYWVDQNWGWVVWASQDKNWSQAAKCCYKLLSHEYKEGYMKRSKCKQAAPKPESIALFLCDLKWLGIQIWFVYIPVLIIYRLCKTSCIDKMCDMYIEEADMVTTVISPRKWMIFVENQMRDT